MLQFLKANSLILFIVKIFEHSTALLMAELNTLILSFQELDELILLEFTTSICVDLVHKVLGLFFIDVQIAGFEHLYYFALGYTARIVSIELHEDSEVLLFGAAAGELSFRSSQRHRLEYSILCYLKNTIRTT